MNETVQKMIVIPLDGSDNALKPLNYLDLVWSEKQREITYSMFYLVCHPFWSRKARRATKLSGS